MSRVRVLVIDGQGGGLGRQLTAALAAGCPDIELTAVGTNSIAASAMLKAGAHRAATGENAVVVNCRRADIIVGPIGIVIADSLLGEITPAMAAAVCQSSAARVPSHPELRLSVSIGGVCNVQPLTEAIRQADAWMYCNKENGEPVL